jgi:hypothetical protein
VAQIAATITLEHLQVLLKKHRNAVTATVEYNIVWCVFSCQYLTQILREDFVLFCFTIAAVPCAT